MPAAAALVAVRGQSGPAPWDAERVGIVALALSALVFGIHSAIDWTWFVPGCAVLGIFAAGFVAGRGPLPALATAGAPARWCPSAAERARLAEPPVRPARVGVGLAVMLAALLCAWAVWQPERSDSAVHQALTLVTQGRYQAAIAKADDAHRSTRSVPKPLLVKSALQDSAGHKAAALATLQSAVIQQPSNPQLWLSLAGYELGTLHNPDAALQALDAALYLDPLDQATRNDFLAASAAARGSKATGGAARHRPRHTPPRPRPRRASKSSALRATASRLPPRRRSDCQLEAQLVQQRAQRAPGEQAHVGRQRVVLGLEPDAPAGAAR